jgi:hypothetical protein
VRVSSTDQAENGVSLAEQGPRILARPAEHRADLAGAAATGLPITTESRNFTFLFSVGRGRLNMVNPEP